MLVDAGSYSLDLVKESEELRNSFSIVIFSQLTSRCILSVRLSNCCWIFGRKTE